ncbi:PLP-dependent aminotransferase family protein [Vibrio sp. JPW-9-11-11]|uniref:aminotransferase-like domain-containing protein n=1 Tax=Vibrio sp. JPW-9-11-11 TaxID=1416532 RepID=UPI001593D779|nr:PLP-dependent aminotransferase family protein [Vibrio sp. JPW-9-11-11]NVD06850.1 PLP-dependent aminotransferase family protein [Vibrio sp. JPW-9-11-11]
MNRYQQLADQIKHQIEQSTWRAGEKVLSIRAASKSYLVSPSTVLQAYQLLESEGWLIAKPQSGYFVTPDRVRRQSGAHRTTPTLAYNDRLYQFLKRSTSAEIAFGSAFPAPDLFPLAVLNRHLASAGRQLPAQHVLHNLPPGNESLRRSIAQRYIMSGLNVSHDDIVLTSGAMEALNLSLATLCKPGDKVVLESPTFYGALQAVERFGLEAITVPVDPQTGLCVSALEQALKHHNIKACWLMSRYHNPTGASLSQQDKQTVVNLAHRYDVAIIEDDVYAELGVSDPVLSPFKYYDQEDKVLLCGSLSKSLCPGYRIGWVVNRRLSAQLQKQQMLSTLSASAPIQQGVAHYLQHESFDNHLRKLRKTLALRRCAMLELLDEHLPEHSQVHVSEGGYFVWVEFAKHVDCHSIYLSLLEEGISVADGGLFGPSSQFNHCLRINVSFAIDSAIEQAVAKIGQLAQRYTA